MGNEHRASLVRRKQEWLIEYLLENPCIECGESDIRCLEFNHRDPSEKWKEVSEIVNQNYGWKKLIAEVAKCEVLCANCHKKHTAKQSNNYKYKYWLKNR